MPLAAVLTFYADVVFVRLWFGAWPSYGSPDAGALHGVPLAVDVAVGLLLAAGLVLSPIVALLLVIDLGLRGQRRRTPVLRIVAGWLVLAACMKLDPGRFVDWFLD